MERNNGLYKRIRVVKIWPVEKKKMEKWLPTSKPVESHSRARANIIAGLLWVENF